MTKLTWSHSQPLIIVANYLPVNLVFDNGWKSSWEGEQLLEAPNGFSHQHIATSASVRFVGRLKTPVPPEAQNTVTQILEELNCIPVFLEPEEAKLFFDVR